MENVVLEAELRKKEGKGLIRSLREAGKLPAVVYGEKIGNIPIALDLKTFQNLLYDAGENAVFKLDISGSSQAATMVMVKELQRGPIRQELIHADLYQLNMKHKVKVFVPIHLEGDAAGEREGGLQQHQVREVEIECLPMDIPEHITMDISNLQIGDSLYVKDLQADEIDIITDPEEMVVTIAAPAAEEEVEEETVEMGEVPQVGKEESEE